MSAPPRRAGKYSPSEGFVLPSEAFTGRPEVDCPNDVGDLARAYWADWATAPVAHFFGVTEWRDLFNTTLLMDRYYETREPKHLAEARQHENNLFGLATRARLHISEARPEAEAAAVVRKPRQDPRLKAV